MLIRMPEAAEKIIKMINEAGFEAYVVGGCVRDSLLGKEPHDWDITTQAKPEDIKKIFRKTIDTGIQHGTVTVLMDNDQYEITTYRIDGEYIDGRHPENVEFTSLLSEDLKRRDFTINAMAYHPEKGLVDLFGGQEDIEAKTVRCVGIAKERFEEDALRMMRAIRFAAVLGYQIESQTFEAIKQLAPNLSKISAERIREEMVKLLVSDNPYMFKLFYESGLTKVFMPEFDKCMETPQNHPHHCYSVGEHILHAVANIEPDKDLRLAMLFHDIAKPVMLTIGEDGITHFYGHPKESGIMARNIMRRLKFDNASITKVVLMAENHDRSVELTEKAMRRVMNNIGADNIPDLLKIKKADVLAQSDYLREEKLENIVELRTLYEKVLEKNQCVSMADLAVSGRDLINEGVQPGSSMGDMLKKMLEDVIENPEHNTKKYLIDTFVKMLLIFFCFSFLLTGCGKQPEKPQQSIANEYILATPGNYDSADTAIIINIDETLGTIQFKTLAIGKYYTLKYDGATYIYDKYGSAISLMQLREGDIVDVTFMKNQKRLNSMQASFDVFKLTDVNDFLIHDGGYKILINGEDYYLSSDLVIMSENGEVELMDINSVDTLIVQGQEHTVESIIIAKGHGYVRLTNSSYFVDGWVQIGQNTVYKVTEDMLLTVPAGTVDITVSKSGSSGTETFNIVPGAEYELDVSKWQAEIQTGNIVFTTTPANALVYIDGEEVDTSSAVEIEYGIHQMMVIAEGYITVNRYIRVASESANLDVTLEKDPNNAASTSNNSVSSNTTSENSVSQNSSASSNTVSSNTSTGSTTQTQTSVSSNTTTGQSASANNVVTVSDTNRVYIDAPEGAEVYVDGTYVGLAPVSFAKEPGTIVVTLRKNGYQTRSYTLTIENDGKDVNYSFSELLTIS